MRSTALSFWLVVLLLVPATASAVSFTNKEGEPSEISLLVGERFVAHFHTFNDPVPEALADQGYARKGPCWKFDAELNNTQPRPCYIELINRLEVQLLIGRKWQISTQLSFAGSSAHPQSSVGLYGLSWPVDRRPIESEALSALVVPEKIRLRYRGKKIGFEIGDFYATFGNGSALNLVRNVPVDSDTTIFGGRIDVNPVDAFGVTALMGFTNPQRVSMTFPNRGVQRKLSDLIYGTEIRVNPKWWLNLSAHAVVLGMQEADPGAPSFWQYLANSEGGDPIFAAEDRPVPHWFDLFALPSVTTLGGSARATSLANGSLDLYFEGNGVLYQDQDTFERKIEDADGNDIVASPWGYNLYFSATGYAGPWTITGEFKRNFYGSQHNLVANAGFRDFQFGAPPTLEVEEAIVEKSSFAVASNELTAFRLQGQTALPKEWLLTVGSGLFLDDESHAPFTYSSEVNVHPFVGLEKGWEDSSHLIMTAGARLDNAVNVPDGEDRAADFPIQLYHLSAIANVALPKNVALDLAVNARYWRGTVQGTKEPWGAMESSFGATWFGGDMGAVMYLDYTSEGLPQIPQFGGSQGNIYFGQVTHTEEDGTEKTTNHSVYLSGEVFFKPWDQGQIKLFVGSSKAGLRCAGGQCRNLPGRSGARLEFQASW